MASQDGDIDHDVDVEALQAQIDLSLAHTQSLVSSWLKPKYGSQTASSSRSVQEKELQDILKRPARLGVGAPLPSSTSIVSRDAMKLKGKLAGKKRGREEEDVKQALPSDDDEQESKARAITKKARHDPFAPKTKKKASTPTTVPTIAAAASSGPSVNATTSKTLDPNLNDVGSSSSPKKKRKKHESLAKASVDRPTSPMPSKPKHKSAQESSTNKPSVLADDSPLDASPSSAKQPASPSKTASHAIPLLNLDGPPPAAEGSPAKKKRKRNKKKKKNEGKQEQPEDAHEADPDNDSSS